MSRRAGNRWAMVAVAIVGIAVLQPLFEAPGALPLNPDWLGPMRLAWLDRAAILGHGRLPLQVPAEAGGMPLLGHPHDLAAGPWLVVILLAGPVLGIKLVAALSVLLGGLGAARFAQVGLRLAPAASALAGGLFMAGAALPAELRSGSVPKLQLALLTWVLVGWHTPGWAGRLLVASGLALVLGHAGLTGAVAVAVLLGWGLLTGTRARWTQALGALPLAALLVVGKAAAVAVLLDAGPLSATKGGEGLAGWMGAVQGMDPMAVLRSLSWPPTAAQRPTWPAPPSLVHLGPAALLLPAAAWGARRHWRVGVWTAGVLLAAVLPLLWLPLVALVPPLQALQKVDKAMVVPVALGLALVAGVGLDQLQQRWGRRAGTVGLVLLVPAVLLSRPLVTGLFPVAALPSVGGELSPGLVVALPEDPAAPWHDSAALWRLSLAAKGVATVGPATFVRPGQPVAGARLALGGASGEGIGAADWRRLAAGLGQGRGLPPATVVPLARAVPAARWVGGPAVVLREHPGRIVLEGVGEGGVIDIARPFDRRWRAPEGVELTRSGDQLQLRVPPGTATLTLRHEATGAVVAWVVGMLAWVAVLLAGLGLGVRSWGRADPAP